MSVTDPQTGTNVHEIAERIADGTAFSFTQYLTTTNRCCSIRACGNCSRSCWTAWRA